MFSITTSIPLIAALGYGASAVFFLILLSLLITGGRGAPEKGWLSLAALTTALWSLISGWQAGPAAGQGWQAASEITRNFAWISFLVYLLTGNLVQRRWRLALHSGWATLAVITLAGLGAALAAPYIGRTVALAPFVIGAIMLQCVAALVLLEQLLRNARTEVRRALRYLGIAVALLFVYDLVVYAQALPGTSIDAAQWAARGYLNALAAPLLGIAISRDQHWALDIFLSRRIVFYAAALSGSLLYLLLALIGGYYVRAHAGSWGEVAQVMTIVIALLGLALLYSSERLRARLKVYISKHFFHYKYEYRDEWLRFTRALASQQSGEHLYLRVVRAVAQIMESSGAVLWLRQDHGAYEPVARISCEECVPGIAQPAQSPLVHFLQERGWVVNLEEYHRAPTFYKDLILPDWLEQMTDAWLVVPLILNQKLIGFIVLLSSPHRPHFNWEDTDVLKTAGSQAASYLAEWEASRALSESRQFEACTRLSAYVVHDLKSMVAQLSLLVSNAARHKHNPAFIEDAVGTIQNSVARMNRLLEQLRSGMARAADQETINLRDLLAEVVGNKSGGRVRPDLETRGEPGHVCANRDRLTLILGHVIQNALDATSAEGSVLVRLTTMADWAQIDVQDSGCGMDEDFVRERLFRPFDTTKGAAGMGIGAYEAREFVRSLAGEVRVVSAPEQGTTFTIRLPLKAAGDGREWQQSYGYNEDRTTKEAAGR